MKRMIPILLALVMTAAMTACKNQGGPSSESSTPFASENAPVSESENSEPTGQGNSNILIAYFSLGCNAEYPDDIDASTSASLVLAGEEMVGTTEYVAHLIQDNIGGDLYSIETVEPYPTDFDTVVDQNHEEMDAGTLPELVKGNLDIAQYDTVFIGYPIWWGIAAWPVDGFIQANDFTGKIVIPFCTSSSSGIGESGDLLEEMAGTGTWLEGMRFRSSASESDVADWIDGLDL